MTFLMGLRRLIMAVNSMLNCFLRNNIYYVKNSNITEAELNERQASHSFHQLILTDLISVEFINSGTDPVLYYAIQQI